MVRERLEAVTVERVDGKHEKLCAAGLFVLVGGTPHTQWLAGNHRDGCQEIVWSKYSSVHSRCLALGRLGRKALAELQSWRLPTSRTLFRWYRDLIAKKFDGSRFRKSRGLSPLDEEIERRVVRMERENPNSGYDRIVGAMANLGQQVSDQTVGNILMARNVTMEETGVSG